MERQGELRLVGSGATGRWLRCGASVLALAAILDPGAVLAQIGQPAADPGIDPIVQQEEAAGGQDPTAEAAEGDSAIVVTGYRESLRSAQRIKQDSDVIVDSVTAEDIGALPDRSVTETLQRIPGVSINRFAAGVDPDHFAAEGAGVVVRGLTYVRSEFNGRDAFTANNGRGLSFADVPSELLGGVDVYKSPSADRIEGGIAGIVDLRTRTPFDAQGLVLAGSMELNYGDFAERVSPTFSILGSNRWETSIGEIGVLGSFSYSQLFTRADRFQVSSFRIRNLYENGDVLCPTDPCTTPIQREVYFPRGAVMGTQEFDRERYGWSAALQWRSPDRSMEALFQFLRSDARQAWTEHAIEIATDNVAGNGDSRRVEGTELSFDEDGLFESGFITGPTGWRADQNTGAARVPILGLQSNNIRRNHEERLVTNDYGASFGWDVTDNFRLTLDYQHVEAETFIFDNGLWNTTYQNVFMDLNGGDLPIVEFRPPQVCSGPAQNATCAGAPGSANSPLYFGAGHDSFLDPFNSFPRAAMDHIEDSTGNSDAFRIDGEFSFPDSGFLSSIKAGYRYADRDQVARFSTYNWGRLSEQWGNNGPVWLDDPVDGIPGGTGGAPLTNYEAITFDNFFRGAIAHPLLGSGRLFYRGNPAAYYDQYVAYANAVNREWEAPVVGADGVVRNGGWNNLFDRAGVIEGTPFLPGEVNPQRETNHAGYVMARFDTDFSNGWNLSGNIGVRYTRTNRVSDGFFSFPPPANPFPTEEVCAQPIPPGQQPPPFCTLSPELRQQARAYLNGALVPTRVEIDYDYWLPSLNLRLRVGEDLQFRAAYFRGIAPPQFGFTRNYFNVTGFGPVQNVDQNGNAIPGDFRLQSTFNAGNPFLVPTEADNFDVTAEWYFASVGQLTASLFYKRLKNVLTNDIARYDIANAEGISFPAVVTTPVNSDETGTIKGFEIAYQQTYDFLPGALSGLGLQANYTFVDSQGVPQSTLSETDPDVGAGRQPTVAGDNFPLQGLSRHTVNITPFFDVGGLSLRASYTWRSRFLLTLRDVITPFDPIFNESTGQLDGSIFYQLTPKLRIGVQAVNILNEKVRTSAAIQGINEPYVLVPRGWYINDRRITGMVRFNF
jgi:TonB-dependent receptor